MKKIKVGIMGYGNLGKAVKKIVENDSRFKLIAVFSRRSIEIENVSVEKVENLKKYIDKIDIMFLCGGSSSTLMDDAIVALKYFNTIDAFDTHKLIKKHLKNCEKVAINSKKVAFCSFGWDPGLFSLMRTLFNSLGKKTFTTWGKGVSQGHTEAIKKIENVKDAIQFTVPNRAAVNKLKRGEACEINNLHKRDCYVVADPEYHALIKNKIVTMPNYFAGYKTRVNYVNQDELNSLKSAGHRGEVFTLGNNFNFSLKTDSNPNLTAKILISYSITMVEFIKKQKYGAYTILDIPFKYLTKNYIEFI